MTFYLCFGRYAGFHVLRDRGVRLILGWVSVAVLCFDLETEMGEIYEALKDVEPNAAGGGERRAMNEPRFNALCEQLDERLSDDDAAMLAVFFSAGEDRYYGKCLGMDAGDALIVIADLITTFELDPDVTLASIRALPLPAQEATA